MKKRWYIGASMCLGMITGIIITAHANIKDNHKWKELSDKHLALMLLFNRWITMTQEGKTLVSYFHNNHIKTIAIYGMSYRGRRLYAELKDSDIEVKYAIHQNAKELFSEINILSLDDELPLVDAVIVTPVYYFDRIYNELGQRTEAEILSLETILYEI